MISIDWRQKIKKIALTELTAKRVSPYLGLRSLALASAQATFKNAPYGLNVKGAEGVLIVSSLDRGGRLRPTMVQVKERPPTTDDGPGEREAA